MAARAQAQETAGNTAGGPTSENLQVVEFLLGKELFAIDLFDVKEVVEYTRITKLPNTPAYIRGIIDLRGEITTIIDLKLKMNIAENIDLSDENKRIIVIDDTITHSKTGIMVDDVASVSTFPIDQVERTSSAMGSSSESHILGIIRKKTRDRGEKESTELVIWIDIRHMFESGESGADR